MNATVATNNIKINLSVRASYNTNMMYKCRFKINCLMKNADNVELM